MGSGALKSHWVCGIWETVLPPRAAKPRALTFSHPICALPTSQHLVGACFEVIPPLQAEKAPQINGLPKS